MKSVLDGIARQAQRVADRSGRDVEQVERRLTAAVIRWGRKRMVTLGPEHGKLGGDVVLAYVAFKLGDRTVETMSVITELPSWPFSKRSKPKRRRRRRRPNPKRTE